MLQTCNLNLEVTGLALFGRPCVTGVIQMCQTLQTLLHFGAGRSDTSHTVNSFPMEYHVKKPHDHMCRFTCYRLMTLHLQVLQSAAICPWFGLGTWLCAKFTC